MNGVDDVLVGGSKMVYEFVDLICGLVIKIGGWFIKE